MLRRCRETTAGELALWHHVVRDVQPLRGPEPEPPSPPAPPPPTVAEAPQSRAVAASAASSSLARAPTSPAPARPTAPPRSDLGNLDRRSWQRLRRGRYPISARLDLHGLTQADAWGRLAGFLAHEQQRGARCVLVITGRGLRSGGVLKSEVPRWLGSPPNAARVLAFAPAKLGHGGEGALYVLLRRAR